MLLQIIHHHLKSRKPADDGVLKDAKMAFPRQYLSNLWKSLEMPLINCKIHLELGWTKNCVTPDNCNNNEKQ